MKRSYLIILGCIATSMLHAQELSGQYTTPIRDKIAISCM